MYNERIVAMIMSCSASVKTVTFPNGIKAKEPIFKVKLESASIDYPQMKNFHPEACATLLNIQPMPFKLVNFGDITGGFKLDLFSEEDERGEAFDSADVSYSNVQIANMTVNVKGNIPVYAFQLEIPMSNPNGDWLFQCVKKKISFEIGKTNKKE